MPCSLTVREIGYHPVVGPDSSRTLASATRRLSMWRIPCTSITVLLAIISMSGNPASALNDYSVLMDGSVDVMSWYYYRYSGDEDGWLPDGTIFKWTTSEKGATAKAGSLLYVADNPPPPPDFPPPHSGNHFKHAAIAKYLTATATGDHSWSVPEEYWGPDGVSGCVPISSFTCPVRKPGATPGDPVTVRVRFTPSLRALARCSGPYDGDTRSVASVTSSADSQGEARHWYHYDWWHWGEHGEPEVGGNKSLFSGLLSKRIGDNISVYISGTVSFETHGKWLLGAKGEAAASVVPHLSVGGGSRSGLAIDGTLPKSLSQ